MLDSLLPARRLREALRRAAATHPAEDVTGPRQLLVDVSEIARSDAATGIQRVVRGILLQLLRCPPPGYAVRPIYASSGEGYRHAERYRARLLAQNCDSRDLAVEAHRGDVFLGLDLAASVIPRQRRTLRRWKRDGVKLHFLVHDLLP